MPLCHVLGFHTRHMTAGPGEAWRFYRRRPFAANALSAASNAARVFLANEEPASELACKFVMTDAALLPWVRRSSARMSPSVRSSQSLQSSSASFIGVASFAAAGAARPQTSFSILGPLDLKNDALVTSILTPRAFS